MPPYTDDPKTFWKPHACLIFQIKTYFIKVPLNVNIVKQGLLHRKQFLKILWSEVRKGGLQLMQILGLLGMHFDAAVVFVTFIEIDSGLTVSRDHLTIT